MAEKYLDLKLFFKKQHSETISLSFAQLEEILGFKLVPSAYRHNAYWRKSDTHVFPDCWLEAGYRLDHLDMQNKVAHFVRGD